MPRSIPVTFPNPRGERLSGRVEHPTGEPLGYALFSPCFTCNKHSAAASRISRGLAERGIAVLRFDFTGLGGSEGDFSRTSLRSNIEDLLSAVDFLRESFAPPRLLVGHSFGATALLLAAERLPEAKLIATIGALKSPRHLLTRFSLDPERIKREGGTEVTIRGRSFPISPRFVEEILHFDAEIDRHLARLSVPLFVFHAPSDQSVPIEEGYALFDRVPPPKHFVSLSGADHLLTREADAHFVVEILSAWLRRYPSGDRVPPRS